MKKIIAITSIPFLLHAQPDISVSGYGSFDVTSAYVLYGAKINKEPCYWTYGELDFSHDDFGSIGGSLWQNTDMTCRRRDSMRRMNEWDWAAFYRIKYSFAENCSLNTEIGHIWYKYHGLRGNIASSIYKTMMEAYGRIELQNRYVTPYVFAAYDWKVTDGSFFTIGIKRDMPLPLDIILTPDITIGGGSDKYLACLYPPWDEEALKDGISYVQLSGKLAYWITDHFGIHMQCAYSVMANDDIRSAINREESDYRNQFLWATCGIDISF
ncbi:MAG: hypothetical protein J6R18_02260 [Kiritimatiellae bacterium]|nr:hypothetical protein [Kiritimatiellia bacterium]